MTYAIISSSGHNGSITPLGSTTVTQGANQTYSISPDSNYHIKDVQVDGVSVGALSAYTFFNVTADHTITASFDTNTYIIAASSAPNGSISPTGSVPVVHGDSQSFTITPDIGYQIGQLIVDGGIVAPTTSYSFTNVSSGHSILANFIPNTYTITASAGDNGSISPVGQLSLEHGLSQTFTIAAAPGYSIADVLVDGASMGAVTSESGNSIEGASVIGNWAVNGNYLSTSSGSTNTEGEVALVSNPIKVKSGDIFSISISDIIKEGFLFNPINNFGPLTVR